MTEQTVDATRCLSDTGKWAVCWHILRVVQCDLGAKGVVMTLGQVYRERIEWGCIGKE